mgnify:CR=1 FL=1
MNMNNPLENLRQLTEAVRMAGADIAPTYIEYVQLAFAIANDCGEAGRNDFLSLCSLSSKYDEKNAQALFSNALHADKEDIHLGTVFHLAGQCGVKISGSAGSHKAGTMGTAGTAPDFPHTCARYNKVENEEKETGKKKHEEEEKEMKGTEPLSPLPYFPQDHDWPEPLKSILSFAKTPAQHDVLLLGAMTVLGASLSHIVRCKYGDKWQYPCLQTFITGHAAAGKSVLVWVRKLIEPIHEEIRRQVAESMKAYRKELRAYEALGKARKDKEPPVAPPNRMFIIPGNNTGTGLLQNLIDSDGTGIICESEADTVSTAIGTEFGNWSDTLRKAFDHDRLSYNRRTDREYKETTACYLSVLLSGTPAQIKPLISSPENGQFSRNIFYYMPRVGEWKDQFGEDELDVEAEFIRMGHEWKASRDELKKKGLFTLKFTQQQKDEFNGHFSALFYRSSLVTGEEMSASVMRMGTILCRMMCITALLRSLEIPSLAVPDPTINPENLKDGIITRHNLSITDEDFRAVLALCEPLYLHATHILSFLDKSTELNSRGIADREMLYAALPQEFTKQMVMEQAEKLNIPVNTARSWMQRLREKGALDMVMVKGKGVYSKKQR